MVCRVRNREEKEERARKADRKAEGIGFILLHKSDSALALQIQN